MSKVKIEGNASGSGTLTISAPNTNTDRTLTLPDGAGEIFVGDITSSDLPAGSVLQVVQATSDSQTRITTDDTGADATPSVTITPSSTSSKILILHTAGGIVTVDSGSIGFGLKRGSTFVWQQSRYGYNSTNLYTPIPFHIHYLDSPSTTSSVTYTPHIHLKGSGDLRHNDNDSGIFSGARDAVTIAMEIAG